VTVNREVLSRTGQRRLQYIVVENELDISIFDGFDKVQALRE